MSIWFLIASGYFSVLVNTHPLLQNVQPYPITNYQQNVYRLPYSDGFVVQPSNINSYSQQLSIQTPLSNFQTLKVPSLTDQLTQIYWDKLLSNPSVSKILDPNKIANNLYGNDVQTHTYPYSTGGVVNNYIIVPPDYLKLNETVSKERTTKTVRNELRRPVKESVTSNHRKKKVLNNDEVNIHDTRTPNIKTPRKAKQDVEHSWNFNTENIKCFTPADVLGNEKYHPEKKINRNKQMKEHTESNKNPKSCINFENRNRSQKCRKTKKKKVSKKAMQNRNNECKEKTENISSSTAMHKKTKKCKKASKMCKCAKKDKLPDCKTKISEDLPQYCDQDMNDFFLSSLMQQGCTNLENRHTRNSKTDTVIKDFRNMYPDLSDDISRSLTRYMNDFFSPDSLQYASSYGTLSGNKYPFDFTQIYQIPQYPNADVEKSKGNTERNRNTRRKKKKKKNSKTNTKKENVSNNDENNHSQIPEINIHIPKAGAKVLETSTPKSQTHVPKIKIHIPEKSTHGKPESAAKVTAIVNDTWPIKIAPVPSENSTTETACTMSATSTDRVFEFFQEPIQHLKEMPESCDENIKSEEENSKEIYQEIEKQIPNSVVIQVINENNSEILEQEAKVIDEMVPTLDSYMFNQLPGLESENEIFNVLMNDYYPDFRADNHAYLVSSEEIDVDNIHDRYFYVTDRNIDSDEIYSPERESNDEFEYNDNKNRVEEEDISEEIVFRTPPGLEVPDFITRKVNRDSTDIYYQHNLEDDYDRFNLDSFADKSGNFIKTAKAINENTFEPLLETVYAKSQVVKYGQVQELDKSIKPKIETAFSKSEDVLVQNDGEKTIVIAKSLQPGEYW